MNDEYIYKGEFMNGQFNGKGILYDKSENILY